MKKVLKFFALTMCVVLLLSLASCGEFMSASKAKKLVSEFGTPQAEMTLTFTTAKGTKLRYVIIYDLLLDKTPITTINFINLVEIGFYKDAIFDSYNSNYNYFLAGRYTYRTNGDSDTLHGYSNVSDVTMVGEFKTNKFREPNGGYEPFSMFSLAMYHEDNAKSFDSANGALIFATASSSSETKKPLNYTNYAVFARMNSISIYEGDSETPRTYSRDQMSSLYLDNLTSQTSTTSCSMTNANGDSSSVTILGERSAPRFVFSITMVDSGKDWSKLPKVNWL